MNTYTWWQWLMFFFTYSFFGWIWESCYVSVRKKRWVNRGFLHLPLLPLYGSGACVILFATMPFQDNLILLYLSGMVGASLLECATGLAMEALYKVKYWDYSDCFLNFKGVICLKASVLWGFFSVMMVKVVHVPIAQMLSQIPLQLVYGAEVVIGAAFVYDSYLSNREALQLAQVLTAMEKAKAEMQENLERMEMELAEQRAILEARLEDAKEHAEEQIVEKIQAALDRMDAAKRGVNMVRRNMNELREDMMDSASELKEEMIATAWEITDDMRQAASEAKEEVRQAADEMKEQAKAEAAHKVEEVKLNLLFQSDALMTQMQNTRENYTAKQAEMMEMAERLSRSMLLRNPTAKIMKKMDLTKELRRRAIRWMNTRNNKVS